MSETFHSSRFNLPRATDVGRRATGYRLSMSDSSNSRQTYLGVAASFFVLAIAMWLTMDNLAIALPFATLALTVFVLGARESGTPESDENDAY